MDEEKAIRILEQVDKLVDSLRQIGMISLLYSQGAPAESCMERIQNIIKELPIDVNR